MHMSKLAAEAIEKYRKKHPHFTIIKEYYVNYKGHKLFFDFYIKEIDLLVEIQGQQHYKFNKHFHGDRSAFLESKKRDNLKIEYTTKNHIAFWPIKYDVVSTLDYWSIAKGEITAILEAKPL